MDLPENVCHILRPGAWDHEAGKRRPGGGAWCDANVVEFCFTGLDHVAGEGRRKGRLLGCPKCLDAAMACLRERRWGLADAANAALDEMVQARDHAESYTPAELADDDTKVERPHALEPRFAEVIDELRTMLSLADDLSDPPVPADPCQSPKKTSETV